VLQPKPGSPTHVVKDGDGDKPYGDVSYADPRYQSDGQKRYPLDTEKHFRAAWSYINMPKNRVYSSEQLAAIKGRVKTAMKRLGIEAGGDEGKAAAASKAL